MKTCSLRKPAAIQLKLLLTCCFFLVIVFTGSAGYAQNQRKLVIDPVGKDTIDTRQNYNEVVKFKIIHVNPFKINGTITAAKQSIDFDVPAQLNLPENTIPASTNDHLLEQSEQELKKQQAVIQYNGDVVKNALKNAGTLGFSKSKSTKALAKKKKATAKARVAALTAQIAKLKESIRQAQARSTAQADFIQNYNQFIITLNKLLLYTQAEGYIDSLLKETFIPDPATLKSNLTEYMSGINDNDEHIDLIRRKCQDSFTQLTDSYIHAKSAYEELSAQVKDKEVTVSGQLTSKAKDLNIKIDSAAVSIEMKSKFDKEFQFLSSRVDQITNEKKRAEIITAANKGVDLYNRVEKSPFEVYTDAVQLDDDRITVTPKLKDKKGTVLKEFGPFYLTTTGGLKVDVSTGYLLSFRHADNYSAVYTNTTTLTGVQKDRSDDLNHTLGILIHVYPRSDKTLKTGGSFGFSVPAGSDESGIGFYGGLSLLGAEKSRFVFTCGLAFNKIQVLNTVNLTDTTSPADKNKGKTYTVNPNSGYKEITYDKLYRPALFVGLTYNIFNAKK